MVLKRRKRESSALLKISDVLQELQYVSRIEDPKERIEAYEFFVPRILDFARRTEDKKLVEIVEEYVQVEERSRSFFRIEVLHKNVKHFKSILQDARAFISHDAINRLLACIENFEDTIEDQERVAWSSVQTLSRITDQLTRELIGRRLEKEIVPELGKQLGYSPGPNILPDNGGELEVDFLGEKNTTTSPLGTGRLKKKEVLIVESKTTISKSEITKFSKKSDIIKSKYEKNAANFRYELVLKAWMFACYGWTEELKEIAMKNDIEPFGENEIKEMLKKNRLLDRRIPICP